MRRSKFEPKVYGEQWEGGAISQGVWEGISLRDLLAYTGLTRNVKELVFEGHDFGEDKTKGKSLSYVRSLPIEKALHEDTIIAFKYGGQPISFQHGAPFRLIVPQWYGMASVKWLKCINVIAHEYTGPYQTEDYVYYPHQDSKKDAFPVTTIQLNSIIQSPLNYSKVKKGVHTINGIAWTGSGSIKRVEISFDSGKSWLDAYLHPNTTGKYTWSKWSYHWNASAGEYKILSRAVDSFNRKQPLKAFWNQKGYGYNAVYEIHVKVE